MTFLDTVDGKLARVTLRSSPFGNVYDHSIDLIHPPFWWWAWIVGLPAAGFTLAKPGLVLDGHRRRLRPAAHRGRRVHRLLRHRDAHLAALRQPLPPDHGAAQSEPAAAHRLGAGRPAGPRHRRGRDLDRRLAGWSMRCGCCRRRWRGGAASCESWLRGADMSRGARARCSSAELARARLPAPVAALAAELAARAGAATAAVLFYGSALRDDALDGVLDFYVLTDRPIAWPGSRLTSLAGRLLPPNVGYLETRRRRHDAARQVRGHDAGPVPSRHVGRRASTPRSGRASRSRWPASAPAARPRRAKCARRSPRPWSPPRAGPPRSGPARGDGDRLLARPVPAHLRRRAAGRAQRPRRRPGRRATPTATRGCCPLAWRAGGLAFAVGDDGLLAPALSAQRTRRRRAPLAAAPAPRPAAQPAAPAEGGIDLRQRRRLRRLEDRAAQRLPDRAERVPAAPSGARGAGAVPEAARARRAALAACALSAAA